VRDNNTGTLDASQLDAWKLIISPTSRRISKISTKSHMRLRESVSYILANVRPLGETLGWNADAINPIR